MPKPYSDDEYYLVDNGGWISGPHPTFGAGLEAAGECRLDRDFEPKGNMALVKVEMYLDNFINNIEE